MRILTTLIILCCFAFTLMGQKTYPSHDMSLGQLDFGSLESAQFLKRKKPRNPEQFKDAVYTGMGHSMMMPRMGDAVRVNSPWKGFSLQYSYLEFQAHYGTANLIHENVDSSRFESAMYIDPSVDLYGKHWTVAYNAPLKFLGIGKQKSVLGTFRGHPTLSFGMGKIGLLPRPGWLEKGARAQFHGTLTGISSMLSIPVG